MEYRCSYENQFKQPEESANDRSYSDKEIRCYRCNRPGHTQQYCRSEKIHFSRGNSSHLVAGQTSLEDKTDHFSFSVEMMAMHTQQQHSSNGCNKWLLDSGCSHHLINTDEYFSNI